MRKNRDWPDHRITLIERSILASFNEASAAMGRYDGDECTKERESLDEQLSEVRELLAEFRRLVRKNPPSIPDPS